MGVDRLLRGWLSSLFLSLSAFRAPILGPVHSVTPDPAAEANELRRELARAEADLAAKNRSIALASHELRTPLNGILGMMDLLSHTSLSAEQTSYVHAARTSATALLALVDDMLDVGKMAAGHWSLKPQPVAVEALVEEVVELLAPRAQAKGLELAAHVAAQVPESVSADPDRLTRILTNLIGNAIKFTDRGGVAIDVSLERQTETDVTLAFRVRDSGIGIPTADQSRIFGEYEQAGAGISQRPAGTGLGLAISRTIARAMGGDITLESAPGEGSVFCFEVALPTLGASMSAAWPCASSHILLISNKSIEPPLLMRRLFDLGASVELARSSDAAHESLASRRPIDAILFDHDGSLDAAEFMATVQPRPPVAVMLAPADRNALDRLRDSGVKAHLVKPMRTASLTKVIAAMLSGETVAAPSMAAEVVRPEPARETSELKILLADDNDINLLLGQSVLRSLGHASDVVRNGILAVARAVEAIWLGHPYDVILMDLHMPELDGFAAIAAIRKDEKLSDHRSLIIALTADTTEHTSLKAIDAGADLALTKPIQHRLLGDALEGALTSRRLQGSSTQKWRRPAT
jgi:signal transduction histidine kinase/CheY-like chemotaxis protein